MTQTQCPTCEGHPYQLISGPTWGYWGGSDAEYEECPTCEGTGTITDEETMTDPMTNTLTELVQELADARAKAQRATETVAMAEAACREQHAEAYAARDMEKARAAELESQVRALALAAHETTGTKAPAPGVSIKLYTTLQYDKAAALEWAKQTKMALTPESLDVKAFEKLAKATAIPCVTVLDEPRVTIASDLSPVAA